MPSSETAAAETSGAASGDHRKRNIALAVIALTQLMVVLDATIVNIALPHIQTALDFSTTGLSWVLNAYTLTFGGLLLLGGRAGDLLGRRRVLIAGILLFILASLLGGFAQEPWQLLAARVLQGVGGAIASPTALALVTSTFPEGPERNRAFGVFAGVSAGGAAIGLLAGGVLTEWLDWRWVFFVNVPIGLLIVFLAPRFINESERQTGRFDIAGALTSTGGMASLVYGFIRAADAGWRDSWTLASFAAAVILLALFVVIENRSPEPITPLKMFLDRNRSGSYVIMLSLAAAMFGMFFFITLFVQNVLGYSPIESGFAFLPVSIAIFITAGISTKFLPRFGPKPFLLVGALLTGSGMAWLTLIDTETTYLGGILLPMLLFGFGMGFNFVTLTLTAVSGVPQGGLGRRVRPAQRHPAGGRLARPVDPGHGVRHRQPGRGQEADPGLHGARHAGAAGHLRQDRPARPAVGSRGAVDRHLHGVHRRGRAGRGGRSGGRVRHQGHRVGHARPARYRRGLGGQGDHPLR